MKRSSLRHIVRAAAIGYALFWAVSIAVGRVSKLQV